MPRTNKPKRQFAEKPFKKVEWKTENQRAFIEDILDNDYTICIGPAGTGKTHISAGLGAEYLHDKTVRKLILTRPCVAAEDIGYLPGDGNDKIHPYLLPLFDELGYFIGVDGAIKSKQVFIEPIAFLRGRTFIDSFIVVDEAQNCTYSQLVMVATRLGPGSKMVINGDLTQTDLKPNKDGTGGSGLAKFVEKVSKCEYGVCTVRYLGKEDIVRHPSVSALLQALERED